MGCLHPGAGPVVFGPIRFAFRAVASFSLARDDDERQYQHGDTESTGNGN